jgi:hypothetical protein
MTCQFVPKAHVAVRTFAEMVAIDPNITVCHHTVEFDEYTFAFRVGLKGEVFAIPADPGWKKAAGAASWTVFVEWTFDTPVVRYVEFAPGRVIEVTSFSASRVAFKEEPGRVK